MRLGLGAKLFLFSLVLVGAGVLAAGVYLAHETDAYVTAALALVLAIGFAAVVSRRVSTLVAETTWAARRMREGDFQVRTHIRGNDELGELGVALDALAAKLSETLGELRAERDLLQRILEGMREGVLVLGEHDRIAMMNPALRDMLLLDGEQRGKMFLEVVRHAELHEVIERTHKEGQAEAEIDIGDIKPRKLLIRASALEGQEGGVLAVCVDVTDVRRLEAMRRDFVANVSHELRTPVAALRSATETLQAGAVRDPKAAERFLGIIERNAARLQALIEDLLELSRLDAKQWRLHIERVQVEPLIQIVMGSFRGRAEQKNVRLSSVAGTGLPPVETDRRAVEQILGNLVDNAIKYVSRGASVTIKATRLESSLRIAVEDTGPGIEERHLPRLFERFYRVDAGRSREVGGTGLGLSIVKHLAEAIGADVGVDSVVGKGSTFWIDLPLS
jgi:two-component system phosphate regulon sensor histidine kinase PhoR